MSITHTIQVVVMMGLALMFVILVIYQWNKLADLLFNYYIPEEKKQQEERMCEENKSAIMPLHDLCTKYFFIREKLHYSPAEAWALACAITHPARN